MHEPGAEGTEGRAGSPPRELRVISQDDVRHLLPVSACIEVVAEALRELSAGRAWMPLRTMLDLPFSEGAVFSFMPSGLSGPGVFGAKVTSVFPLNEGSPLQSHQGAVLLFEAHRGRLLAIVDGSAVTATRTPAASALATRLLAREDAGDLALLGSGVQAAGHLEAIAGVRKLRSVRVWSRTRANAERFAEEQGDRVGVVIEPVATAEQAVRDADIVCTTTPASEPVLRGVWLAPGAHVNAVGFAGPTGRELDGEAVARSQLFVDRRESTANEAGEFLLGLAEGAFGRDHIVAEIGEVLLGRAEGRRSANEITLFRSLGVAVEDLAAARYVYERALEAGGGTKAFLGGFR